MEDNSNYNIIVTGQVTPLEQQPEPIRDRPWYTKIGRRLVAFVFILAMLFLFGGFYQFGLLQKTPEDTPVGQYEAVVDLPARSVPATVFVLSEEDPDNAESVRTLVDKSNQLLHQAVVRLDPIRVEMISVANIDQPAGQVATSPAQLRELLPNLDPNRLHIVVTSGLAGINGVAFPGRQVVAVAEYTSSFDFRVLAHEVGHILSLDHVSDGSNLMHSGGAGTMLTPDQARTANQSAHTFVTTES